VDLRCSLVDLKPGDKIVVWLKVAMDRDQVKTLRRKIEKWAGSGVEVLILDERVVEMEYRRGPRAVT